MKATLLFFSLALCVFTCNAQDVKGVRLDTLTAPYLELSFERNAISGKLTAYIDFGQRVKVPNDAIIKNHTFYSPVQTLTWFYNKGYKLFTATENKYLLFRNE